MSLCQHKYLLYVIFAELLFCGEAFATVEFEPGIGVGVEYTDNAALTRESQVNDLMTTGYVGARVSENEGALRYDAVAAFNNHNYTKDTFSDQRYFNLGASADWEMVRNRFNWLLSDYFYQRPIISNNSNTPDNLEDSNVFTVGADINFPISSRQSFNLSPIFNQYYYEVLFTDNKQYSLSGNWNYQLSRLTNVGLNFSVRKINYTEKNFSGQSIEGVTFTNMAIAFSGQRLRSVFTGNLGATNVRRDNAQETTGFAGLLNWLTDLSSRSKFEILISTDITDTSSVAANVADSPAGGSGNNVQITADVVRNSGINLTYSREDSALDTRISARYHKLKYSESPFDSIVRGLDLQTAYPVTQLLSNGVYINYYRDRRLDTERLDKRFIVGTNLRYDFSRKLQGLFDLKYRKKESTYAPENYDEFSVFVSLVYGFGEVSRPTRVAGF